MNEREGVPSYIIYLGIFFVVFVIALGAFLYMSQSKVKSFTMEATKYAAPQEPDKAAAAKPSNSPNENLKLTIASPENNTFIPNNTTKIAGATKPGATVSITGGTKDVVNEVNSDGSFVLDVPLKEGENELTITVFDQTGQQKSETRTVVALVEG